MTVDIEMMNFWSEKHINQDIRSLSGNGYITIFYLHLDDIFPGAKTILNIGVGTGKFEKACIMSGKRVNSMDVAKDAYGCINQIVDCFYYKASAITPNNYDLITELLVAQHVNNEELESHIKYAIVGLKPNGVYAIQSPTYITLPSHDEEAKMQTTKFMQGGRVCRSNKWFEDMATKHGGIVDGIHRVWKFPEYNMIWNAYHIRRRA